VHCTLHGEVHPESPSAGVRKIRDREERERKGGGGIKTSMRIFIVTC